jgi:hypothetical protein
VPAKRTYGPDEPSRAVIRAIEAVHESSSLLAAADVTQVAAVVDILRPSLAAQGWKCSLGRRSDAGLPLPCGDGRSVLCDCWHPDGAAIWFETGRSWTNFGFLQHVIEAAVAEGVDHALIGVRNRYNGQSTWDYCADFLDLIYSSTRLQLPMRSVTLVGI